MQVDWIQVYNQLFSSSLTACFTVFGGIVVLILGQLALKLFVEPINKQAELVGEIAHSLTFYANYYGNASLFEKDDLRDAVRTLRSQASRLRASAWTIRWYGLWQLMGITPRKADLLKASEYLIALSNSMTRIDAHMVVQIQKDIPKLLRFAK